MAACSSVACSFERDYEIAQTPLMRQIERSVRGSDYGGTSWTTRAQAEQSAVRLALARGQRFLEVGAGSGWPALFLATLSDCDFVLTDLPLTGLHIARQRAATDGLSGRCRVLAADGAALPFAAGSFDHLHHADVLCCMDRKRDMLRECRRVAATGARMEFSVISLVRGPEDDHERQLLLQSGPSYPDAGGDYSVLLDDTGWAVLERFDVTTEFLRCMDVLLEQLQAHRSALVNLLGQTDYAERLQRRRSTRAAVLRGLLVREIFLAQAFDRALVRPP